MELRSYDALNDYLGDRLMRKLEYGTIAVRLENGAIAVRFHLTDIVTYTRDGFTVSAGGWYTANTLRRINQYTPREFTVKQVTVPERVALKHGVPVHTIDCGRQRVRLDAITDRYWMRTRSAAMIDHAARQAERASRQYWTICVDGGTPTLYDTVTDCVRVQVEQVTRYGYVQEFEDVA